MTIVEPKGVSWDKDLKRWNAPFIMAGINTRIVARSAALLGREPFNYMETMSFSVSHGMGLVRVIMCEDSRVVGERGGKEATMTQQ